MSDMRGAARRVLELEAQRDKSQPMPMLEVPRSGELENFPIGVVWQTTVALAHAVLNPDYEGGVWGVPESEHTKQQERRI